MQVILDVLMLDSGMSTVGVMSIVQDLNIWRERTVDCGSTFWTINQNLWATLPYGDGLCCVCGDGNLSYGGWHDKIRKA